MSRIEVLTVKILRLEKEDNDDIPLPRYMTQHCAGMDIRAAIKKDIILKPGSFELIPTGFALEIPTGFEAQIRPRSGLAVRDGISVLNSPGTIDSDYRGEIKIILINLSRTSFTLTRGDRIAQMVITKVYRASFDIVEKLEITERGSNGFGHTG